MPCTFACSGICFSTSGVRTYPGQIAFAVIPCCATSSATVLVKPARPCFADTYADLNGLATSACAEAMLTMRPQRRFFIAGSASRVVWKADETLGAMMRSHLSTGNSSTGATCCTPALFTRMSTAPNLSIAFFIIAAIAAGFVMSAPSYTTCTPFFAARSFRSASICAASPKPFNTILAPSTANRVAMPRPMPDVEPVTSAVLFFSMGSPSNPGVHCRADWLTGRLQGPRLRLHRLPEAHLREHGAAREAVGTGQGFRHLEVVVAVADEELHRLARGLQRGGEVTRLALELRRLERAIGE